MGCKRGGECVESRISGEEGYCSKCYSKMNSSVKVSDYVKLGAPDHCLRIVLLGHGTYQAGDGQFLIPEHVRILFKVPHGSTSMGTTLVIEHMPNLSLTHGMHCYNYRLWPLVGEEHHLPASTLVPYHHAHHPEHSRKLHVGAQVIMYSERSGDGPRLSSIVNRVRGIVGPGIVLEFLWLPCREVVTDNYVIQRNMSFDGISPISAM